MDFSHLDGQGAARMVDVSSKEPVKRRAAAEGSISLEPATIEKLKKKIDPDEPPDDPPDDPVESKKVGNTGSAEAVSRSW